jgi:hypothetical protein
MDEARAWDGLTLQYGRVSLASLGITLELSLNS